MSAANVTTAKGNLKSWSLERKVNESSVALGQEENNQND